MSRDGLAMPLSSVLRVRCIEIVGCLDLLIAPRAHDSVMGECAKPIRLVLLLEIDQLARIAPTLFVGRIVAVFDEAQGGATILDEVPTHGSHRHAPMVLAVDFKQITHDQTLSVAKGTLYWLYDMAGAFARVEFAMDVPDVRSLISSYDQ